jgi:putative Mg2+ transporter-C (MgtC) family protein
MDSPTQWEMASRVLLALAAGITVGIERESHGRAAGLRTTMLACVAAAIAMVLSETMFAQSAGPSWRPDPARLAAGVLTGMGFLGAGTILREGKFVRGITTAAVLWIMAVIGLAFGAGEYWLAGVGWIVTLSTLLVMPYGERLVSSDRYGDIRITCSPDGPSVADLSAELKDLGLVLKGVSVSADRQAQRRTLWLSVKYKRGDLATLGDEVVRRLSARQGVLAVRWR